MSLPAACGSKNVPRASGFPSVGQELGIHQRRHRRERSIADADRQLRVRERAHRLERLAPRPPLRHVGQRNDRATLTCARGRFVQPGHGDEPGGIAVRQRSQQHGVDDAEHGRRDADAEREHDDGDGGKAAMRRQRTDADAEFLPEDVQSGASRRPVWRDRGRWPPDAHHVTPPAPPRVAGAALRGAKPEQLAEIVLDLAGAQAAGAESKEPPPESGPLVETRHGVSACPRWRARCALGPGGDPSTGARPLR